jgi:hypothetical protein
MSKRILLLIGLLIFLSMVSLAQNKRAERKAASKAKKEAEIVAGEARFTKAVSAINAKDFVIFVDVLGHTQKINRDPTNFLSYETDFVFLQGYAAGNQYTNKLTVSKYSQTNDKDGNVTISMQVRGFYIDERIEISLKKGDNIDEVNIIPGNRGCFYYSGELVTRSESDYFKRPNEI